MISKNALITGATGGIGEAIARRLGSLGYSLALIYGTNHVKAKALKDELEKTTFVKTYSCDFNDLEDMNRMMDVVMRDFGSFQVVIHGAGISYRSMFHETEDEIFEKMMNINIKPLFYITKRVVPDMIEKCQGDIISISSIWGSRAASMEVTYAMTKGALEQFTRGLASELSHMNIRVNAIAPGGIDTAILNNLSKEEKEVFIEDIPFKRLGTPIEIADLIEFLILKGKYITGQVLTIDGGYTL